MDWKKPHHLYYGIILILLSLVLYVARITRSPYVPIILLSIGVFLSVDDVIYHLTGIGLFSTVFSETYVAILTTFSEDQEASEIIHGLLNRKLIACGNRFPCKSLYWWEGTIEKSDEVYSLLKTPAKHVSKVIKFIKLHHSYEVPQIVVIPIKRGSKEYMDYLTRVTA